MSDGYKDFTFSEAVPGDNKEIVEHVKRNPIRMELDYIIDRHEDFFKIQRILEGSKVLIARNKLKGEIAACLTLLKFEGNISNSSTKFQYITDLVKDVDKGAPLLMQKLLNYALKNFHDTDLVLGLINEANAKAIRFSTSGNLLLHPEIVAKFNYYEIIPFKKHRIPYRFRLQHPTNNADLRLGLEFINEHYREHLLFYSLSIEYLHRMFKALPHFSFENILMLYEEETLKGVSIFYDPSDIVSLVVKRMGTITSLFIKFIKVVNELTGLLISPPTVGERIKTLQVRYLAGDEEAQQILLSYANNLALQNGFHTISLLIDERENLNFRNKFVYKYKSLMYAGFKQSYRPKADLFAKNPVFFDITFA